MVDFLLPLRGIQFLFAIISLGLNGYGKIVGRADPSRKC